MNRFAYRTTGLAIKALENLSRANVRLHDVENVPDKNIIFVINHFTRLETLLMPTHLFKITQGQIMCGDKAANGVRERSFDQANGSQFLI